MTVAPSALTIPQRVMTSIEFAGTAPSLDTSSVVEESVNTDGRRPLEPNHTRKVVDILDDGTQSEQDRT